MADESKELLQWQAGWKRAESIAMYTLSGLPMDANPQHRDAMFRTYQAAVQLWERLCCREQHAESEVKAAARQIGLMLDKDNKLNEKRLGLIQFNRFETLNGQRKLATELGWIVDIYLRGPNAIVRPHPSIRAFGLELWMPWEIIYVTGLRAIDAAVKAINAGDTELGLCLTFDALNEMYLCDDFATGNERNKAYAGWVDAVFNRNRGAVAPKESLVEKIRNRINPPVPVNHKPWERFMERERPYVEARRVFTDLDTSFKYAAGYFLPPETVAERLKITVDAAVKSDRVQLAKAAATRRNEKNQAMRKLVIERWKAEKKSYENNKSDFARHYARILLNEHEFEVEASTIATRWLRGL